MVGRSICAEDLLRHLINEIRGDAVPGGRACPCRPVQRPARGISEPGVTAPDGASGTGQALPYNTGELLASRALHQFGGELAGVFPGKAFHRLLEIGISTPTRAASHMQPAKSSLPPRPRASLLRPLPAAAPPELKAHRRFLDRLPKHVKTRSPSRRALQASQPGRQA